MSEATPRKKYTMSERAIAQRRANQPKATELSRDLSTGPVTEEGKASSSRNAWVHGRRSAINRQQFGLGATSVAKLFGKPCQTTCPYHPDNPTRTEKPCGLVLDGLTHAGGSCLDKTVYVLALDSLMGALESGEMDGMNGLLATQMASTLQIVDQIRQQIAQHGVLVPTYEVNRDGEIVLHPKTGEPMVFELKMNPAVAALAKFMETMGINFGELMATPRAREKLKDDEDAANGLANAIGAIFNRGMKRLPKPALDSDG